MCVCMYVCGKTFPIYISLTVWLLLADACLSFFGTIEYIDVGTEKVLESPHVSEGPGRIANSPVPSIYVDDRGEIHRFRVGGTRINMLFSKKDVMRSGYLHNHKTFSFVVKGSVELWLLEKEGTVKTVYGAGCFFQVSSFFEWGADVLQKTALLLRLTHKASESSFSGTWRMACSFFLSLSKRLIHFIRTFFTFWKML